MQEQLHYSSFKPGDTLVVAGKALTDDDLKLLELEREQALSQTSWRLFAQRGLAMFALLGAVFAMNGYYIARHEKRILVEFKRLATLLLLVVVATSAVGWMYLIGWTAADPGLTQLLPLLLFGITMAIAYRRDLAWVLSLSGATILAVLGGLGFSQFVILMATVTAAIMQLDEIRTRNKLILVGGVSSVVAAVTTLIVGVLDHQPWAWPLWQFSLRNGLWTLAAGFLDHGLLPFIEKLFGVLTDISLLELGDVSHPLLQELVRRAPGTYNHSINVASIAEAAAESIGARGLLRARRGLLPRHRQDAQAGLLRREPRAWQGNRHENAAAGDEHADHHRPRQRRRRPGPAASPAAADHRLHRAASRHDAGRILLSPRQRAERRRTRTAAKCRKARSAIPARSRRPTKRPC